MKDNRQMGTDYPTIIVPKREVLLPKTILVDGISGSGKTTVADMIADELGISALHGDPLMFNSVPCLQQEMEAGFGERPGSERGLSYLGRQFNPAILKKERQLSTITNNCVEEQLEWMTQHPAATPDQYFQWMTEKYKLTSNEELQWMLENFQNATYNANADNRSVVEHCTSSTFKRMWDAAAVRLVMNPTNQERWQGLLEKKATAQGLTVDAEFAERRKLATFPRIKNARNVDYMVPNAFDDKLEEQVHNICKDIMDKGVLR